MSVSQTPVSANFYGFIPPDCRLCVNKKHHPHFINPEYNLIHHPHLGNLIGPFFGVGMVGEYIGEAKCNADGTIIYKERTQKKTLADGTHTTYKVKEKIYEMKGVKFATLGDALEEIVRYQETHPESGVPVGVMWSKRTRRTGVNFKKNFTIMMGFEINDKQVKGDNYAPTLKQPTEIMAFNGTTGLMVKRPPFVYAKNVNSAQKKQRLNNAVWVFDNALEAHKAYGAFKTGKYGSKWDGYSPDDIQYGDENGVFACDLDGAVYEWSTDSTDRTHDVRWYESDGGVMVAFNRPRPEPTASGGSYTPAPLGKYEAGMLGLMNKQDSSGSETSVVVASKHTTDKKKKDSYCKNTPNEKKGRVGMLYTDYAEWRGDHESPKKTAKSWILPNGQTTILARMTRTEYEYFVSQKRTFDAETMAEHYRDPLLVEWGFTIEAEQSGDESLGSDDDPQSVSGDEESA